MTSVACLWEEGEGGYHRKGEEDNIQGKKFNYMTSEWYIGGGGGGGGGGKVYLNYLRVYKFNGLRFELVS